MTSIRAEKDLRLKFCTPTARNASVAGIGKRTSVAMPSTLRYVVVVWQQSYELFYTTPKSTNHSPSHLTPVTLPLRIAMIIAASGTPSASATIDEFTGCESVLGIPSNWLLGIRSSSPYLRLRK